MMEHSVTQIFQPRLMLLTILLLLLCYVVLGIIKACLWGDILSPCALSSKVKHVVREIVLGLAGSHILFV